MELVRGINNKSRLDQLNREAIKACESVDAAVAYVSEERTLLDACWNNKKALKLWARYDYSIPVSLPILKKFLDRQSERYVCRLVPDHYHPKVIWWRKFGAYIGSANLSDPAWFSNIEAGIFFYEEELYEHGIAGDLEEFFDHLNGLSEPLTRETYDNLVEWSDSEDYKGSGSVRAAFAKMRRLQPRKGLSDITKEDRLTRLKKEFLSEWDSTLELLRKISQKVSLPEYRPDWVPKNAAAGTQADQFLHALYYTRVRDGNRHPYMEWFRDNRADPDSALQKALEWWSDLDSPPGSELQVMKEWSGFLLDALSEKRVGSLSEREFVDVCARVHAIRDHSLRVGFRSFGLSQKLPQMDEVARHEYFAKWLFKQRSPNGASPMSTLKFVLYGGPQDKTPDRMFEACYDPKRKIPHFGISSIGEIIGWARPDIFPPRNGRTSKALTALGYPVKIHSGEGSEE